MPLFFILKAWWGIWHLGFRLADLFQKRAVAVSLHSSWSNLVILFDIKEVFFCWRHQHSFLSCSQGRHALDSKCWPIL